MIDDAEKEASEVLHSLLSVERIDNHHQSSMRTDRSFVVKTCDEHYRNAAADVGFRSQPLQSAVDSTNVGHDIRITTDHEVSQ